MVDELPRVTVDGGPCKVVLFDPRLPMNQDRTFSEEHLTALLAALPNEQRQRVLEPYVQEHLSALGDLDDYARDLLDEKEREAHYRLKVSAELHENRSQRRRFWCALALIDRAVGNFDSAECDEEYARQIFEGVEHVHPRGRDFHAHLFGELSLERARAALYMMYVGEGLDEVEAGG